MTLSVIDGGTLSAWRSQALWHGIAASMQTTSPATLSFCRPAEAYVGIGYHRRLDEIDVARCAELDLPIIRRQIGGGPVYLDQDQLFFQLTLPAADAPRRVDRLYQQFLDPAVHALKRLGIAAHRNGFNDLAVAGRKISGTGAGQIGDGVTVVGNILFRFSHQRMVEVLSLPSARMRRECLRLMRRHVTSLAAEGAAELSPAEAKSSLIEAFSGALGKSAVTASLSPRQQDSIAEWEVRFRDTSWRAGVARPKPARRQVKISTDAWLFATPGERPWVEVSIVGGQIAHLSLEQGPWNGTATAMQGALAGQPAEARNLEQCLAPFGDDGRQLLDLLLPGLDNN